MFSFKLPKLNLKAIKFDPKKYLLIYLTISLIIIIFVLGFSLGQKNLLSISQGPVGKVVNVNKQPPKYLSQDVDFGLFWEVWNYAKKNYIKTDILDTQLFYGALAGIVSALKDPYSVFLEPETSEKFEQELSGSFEGIGAEIGIRKERLTIIAPLPDSPAEKAGLRVGDRVLAIDDYDTTGIALDYAVSLIRGPKGTTVTLTIYQESEEKPQEITITRDTIKIPSVTWELKEEKFAYLKVLYLNDNTLPDFDKAVSEILVKNPQGIILDVRNNPGGYLTTAIEVAGEWVEGKTIVLERLRGDKRISHFASRRARLAGIPTVVLVNQGSASGSEIIAGALQDYELATVVGEQTFGKGSVQDLKKFKDGSSVKLTIAEWLTPNGRNINEEGIKPDMEVELTKEDYENDRDPQLDKALELLRK